MPYPCSEAGSVDALDEPSAETHLPHSMTQRSDRPRKGWLHLRAATLNAPLTSDARLKRAGLHAGVARGKASQLCESQKVRHVKATSTAYRSVLKQKQRDKGR